MKKGKKIEIEQLDKKIASHRQFPAPPAKGWIRATRTAMNMTLPQMADLMALAPQNILSMEKREALGTISLKTLQKAATALNMKLVYGFLPIEGSFEKLIEKRALIVARKIVERTNTTMKLEDQQVSKDRLENAVRELAEEIKNEMPRYLWD